MVLVEIDSLDGEQGCWASNDYLATFFGLSKGRISKVISSLKEKGYITVQLTYKQGTKEIQKRTIRVDRGVWSKTSIPYGRKQLDPLVENVYTPIVENSQDNNTVINNTKNNTKTDSQSSVGHSQIDPNFKAIQDLYNQLIGGTNHRDNERINEALEFYEPALILEAVKAGANNAKSFQYILGILDNWRRELEIHNYIDWQQKLQKGGNGNATNRPDASGISGKTPEERAFYENLRNFGTGR